MALAEITISLSKQFYYSIPTFYCSPSDTNIAETEQMNLIKNDEDEM